MRPVRFGDFPTACGRQRRSRTKPYTPWWMPWGGAASGEDSSVCGRDTNFAGFGTYAPVDKAPLENAERSLHGSSGAGGSGLDWITAPAHERLVGRREPEALAARAHGRPRLLKGNREGNTGRASPQRPRHAERRTERRETITRGDDTGRETPGRNRETNN